MTWLVWFVTHYILGYSQYLLQLRPFNRLSSTNKQYEASYFLCSGTLRRFYQFISSQSCIWPQKNCIEMSATINWYERDACNIFIIRQQLILLRVYISSALPVPSLFCKSQSLLFLSSKSARILNLIFIIKVIPEVGKQWFRDDESNFALACQTENNRD